MRGLEPPTPRITTWCSSQLSYIHRKTYYMAKNAFLAMQKGHSTHFNQNVKKSSVNIAKFSKSTKKTPNLLSPDA
jgi:hypothetical protein